MKIEVWSDVVCPWCYIGKRNLEAAIAEFTSLDPTAAAAVEIVWRSFELDPSAPKDDPIDLATMLASKYGTDHAGALEMLDRVSAVAEQAGLHYRFDLARRSNTFDAHRVIHLGAELGCQDDVKERLLAAYFCEGAELGSTDTLVELATEAGLPADRVREVLEGDEFVGEVRADEQRARELAISGVPFFLIDGLGGVSGAQPPERLLQMLQRAAAKAG